MTTTTTTKPPTPPALPAAAAAAYAATRAARAVAKAKRAEAEAKKIDAEANKINAEAMKARAETVEACNLAKLHATKREAIERLTDAIAQVRQQGGSVSFDIAALRQVLDVAKQDREALPPLSQDHPPADGVTPLA